MTLLETFALAIALSMDAVSVGAAVGLDHRKPRQVFRLAFHFGLFQALMPLLGALFGTVLLRWVRNWDHWVVFAALGGLGARMIWLALRGGEEEKRKAVDLTRGWSLIGLSVATSIDALAAGIGIAAAGASIGRTVAIVGLVTATATAAAMLGANRFANGKAKVTEVVAGVVLIALGAKTLYEHLR